ncbi:hypothetical protein OH782_41375 (plasmid) [Streptomyces sp. NBC_01544]|uniref:hypothetical protein n=1 Tax=Streptomyces sp. NBC_01544 TaxID=2975871 RepID=UPI002F909B85
MSELPPDPPRLRAILAHLNQQLTENETVVIYLRLQRDAVQAALTRTEQPSPLGPRRPGRPVKGGSGLPALAQADGRVGFVVQLPPQRSNPVTLPQGERCLMRH